MITFDPPEGLTTLPLRPDAARRLDEHGVRLLGQLPVPGGHAAIVTLAVLQLPARQPVERGVLAAALVDLLRRRIDGVDARSVLLPCGPAAATQLHGELRLPSGTESVPVHRARFLIPLPGPALVLLDVGTGDEAAWPATAEISVALARSINLPDEGEAAT